MRCSAPCSSRPWTSCAAAVRPTVACSTPGVSLTPAGVRVVEFNARFGDPETQVILDRLATPLAGLLAAAASGSLAGLAPPRWAPGAAVTVVIAAEGYPGPPARGDQLDRP